MVRHPVVLHCPNVPNGHGFRSSPNTQHNIVRPSPVVTGRVAPVRRMGLLGKGGRVFLQRDAPNPSASQQKCHVLTFSRCARRGAKKATSFAIRTNVGSRRIGSGFDGVHKWAICDSDDGLLPGTRTSG